MNISKRKRVFLLLLAILFFCWPIVLIPQKAWTAVLLIFLGITVPALSIGLLSRKYASLQTPKTKALVTFFSIGLVSFILAITLFRQYHYIGEDIVLRSFSISITSILCSIVSYVVIKRGKKVIGKYKQKG